MQEVTWQLRKAFWLDVFSPLGRDSFPLSHDAVSVTWSTLDYKPWLSPPLRELRLLWPLQELTGESGHLEAWWLECLGDHPACTGVWGQKGQPCVQDTPWRPITAVRAGLAKPALHVLRTNNGFSTKGYKLPIIWWIVWFFNIKHIMGFSLKF